ncbi:MAG: PIN domain-containing protein [Synergistaceae bacterium]|jgi:PIN domain nuclease of toxin-antitoxin system|nr:PIN domain-containing protein [Synergistaceae bacterium]
MTARYVLDACALIAFLTDEAGGDTVGSLLEQARAEKIEMRMNSLNLLEVYYGLYREYGKEYADSELAMIKKLPVTFNLRLDDEVLIVAGRLKASYRVSLADSVALAEAFVSGGSLLTADHHELDAIEQSENIKFSWIR